MNSTPTLQLSIKRLALLTLASLVAVAALLGIAASAQRAKKAEAQASKPAPIKSGTRERLAPHSLLTTYTNATAITINNSASPPTAASVYPSNIVVSGSTGTITDVNVVLNNVTAPRASDIDILLVGPQNQKFVIISDAGGNTSTISSVTATFDSQAATVYPDSGGATGWGTGSNSSRPANYSGLTDTFPAPAPAGPYQHPVDGDSGASGTATFDSVFDGADANGTWSLYVVDDSVSGSNGSIAGGWSLVITTASLAATSTTLTSSLNPSFTAAPNGQTTLTATVTSGGSPVTSGTVDFQDGGVTFQTVALNGSGQAVSNHTFPQEGNRQVTAVFSGTASFALSTSNTVSQEVNNHTTVSGSNYSNDIGPLTIVANNGSNSGIARPYSSKIFVPSGLGTITDLNVTLHNVTHDRASDLDLLLVAPSGQRLVLVSDAGGNTTAISNVTVTFDDASGTALFGDSGSATGWGAASSTITARPVNRTDTTDTWPSPAPVVSNPGDFPQGDGPGTATLASKFNGADPAGTWGLYVIDDSSTGASGSIAGGWSLNFTFAVAAATSTTVLSNNNPSFTAASGNSVMFTASVTAGSTVNEGTVTFQDNGVALPGSSTVNVASGQAQFTTTFASEGNHPITAVYNGTANFGTSTGGVTQEVNNHTTINGNMFSNSLTGITINENDISNSGKASPYPSKIFIGGLTGTITDLNVTLLNVTEPKASDLDILLVGPGGQKFVLVSDAGGNTTAISNVTVTFDDSSATPLFGDSASSTGWGVAGSTITALPVNRTDTNDTWPSPAPAAPYQFPQGDGGGTATLASVFNGASPNGTWSLYVIDDGASLGQNGSIAGGWRLTFALTPASVAATAGNNQGALLNAQFATDLQTTVTDTFGNGAPGVVVTFTANSSSGGATGKFANNTNTTQATTNASGVATASHFTANGQAGYYTVSAAAAGVASPTTFNLRNMSSPTASPGIVSGRIVDDHGVAVEGAVVRLSGAQNRKFITDANGFYRFYNVETSGFYTVTPTRANYSFNPSFRSFSQIGEATEAAFGATVATSNLVNPLDTPEYFVRQHYLDFLGREPDEAGFNFWSDQILECGAEQSCVEHHRENVSAAYFLSIEFQQTGGLVDGLYRASYGTAPDFAHLMPDSRAVGQGVQVGTQGWEALLQTNKEALVNDFVNRPAFRQLYDAMDNSLYVDTLISHTGVVFTAAERDALVGGLANGGQTRADVLRSVAENERFVSSKFKQAFVMMEYFGYLRRDADAGGYAFWLDKLNQFGGNFERAEMVKAFIVSGEYRDRFPH